MRTREEQIKPSGWQFQDSEGNWADTTMPKWYQSEGYKVRPLYTEEALIEAYRRAEQRVRAEIGRDSERLDWLAETVSSIGGRKEEPLIWKLIFVTRSHVSDPRKIRIAIDAAREVG